MYTDTRCGRDPKYFNERPPDWNMRIPDQILNCVCFLCVKLNGGENAGLYKPIGTAFFVGVGEENVGFVYLVTARHVIDAAKQLNADTIYARLNIKGGRFEHIAIDLRAFGEYIDADIDVTVAPFHIDPNKHDIMLVSDKMLVTEKDIQEKGIGEGDDLFVTGLFVHHSGKERNIPIVRSGIIAAMPYELFTGNQDLPYAAYLAELRSIGGLSGSPVFVYFDNRRIYDAQTGESRWQFLLLGLIRGHWNLKQDLNAGDDWTSEDIQPGIGKGEYLNTGIALVTPSQTILTIIHGKEMQEMRQRIIKQVNQEHAPVEDAVSVDDFFTNEDFTDALKKASRRTSEPVSEKKET